MINDDIRIFFGRSKLRYEVLKELNNKPQIASFLAQKLKKHRESISRIFLDLQKEGFAICINSESSNFRKYKITKKGKLVLKEIEQLL